MLWFRENKTQAETLKPFVHGYDVVSQAMVIERTPNL